MKRDVECLSPLDPAQSVAKRMRDRNVGFLPVCDEDNSVLGIVTDRDIVVRLVADEMPLATPVKEIMSFDVVSCHPRDDVRRAQQLMGDNRTSRIVCVDDLGRLVGTISLADILRRQSGIGAAARAVVAER
jgi:CBS domain-containing protein